jgi:hypothetical protein
MAENFPPVPYKQPVLKRDGFLNEVWAKWFQLLFTRVGGVQAPSNSDVERSIKSLETRATNLESSVNDLNQGRHL